MRGIGVGLGWDGTEWEELGGKGEGNGDNDRIGNSSILE